MLEAIRLRQVKSIFESIQDFRRIFLPSNTQVRAFRGIFSVAYYDVRA